MRRPLVRVLQARVDKLVIGFNVRPSRRVMDSLVHAKRSAACPGHGGQAAFAVGVDVMALHARSLRGHPFVLRNADAEVLVARDAIVVTLQPALLRRTPLPRAISVARGLAANLCERVEGERVRRIDACADVTFELGTVDPANFARRAKMASVAFKDVRAAHVTTGLTFGNDGSGNSAALRSGKSATSRKREEA